MLLGDDKTLLEYHREAAGWRVPTRLLAAQASARNLGLSPCSCAGVRNACRRSLAAKRLAKTTSPDCERTAAGAAARERQGSADAEALCRETQQIVAHAFQVALTELRCRSRCGAEVALARQAAMYLANVAGGVSFPDVARGFGRDRSTVAHACSRIEDLRDDPSLDRSLALLEGALRSTFRLPDLH